MEHVLREAQRRRPADFWLNNDLAQELGRAGPEKAEEALGFFRAALAHPPRQSRRTPERRRHAGLSAPAG